MAAETLLFEVRDRAASLASADALVLAGDVVHSFAGESDAVVDPVDEHGLDAQTGTD